jgi:hypothetical protein
MGKNHRAAAWTIPFEFIADVSLDEDPAPAR